MDNDLKRILAYSTIENIGLIFVGLGLAYAFHASGFDAAAALAMTAALLHAFNHALFKSLLVLRRRRRPDGDRRTAAGPPRRAPQPDAGDRTFHARRRRRDLGPAAAQRLRLGMDDPAGGVAEPELPAMDAEDSGARGRGERRADGGAGGRLFRAGFRHSVSWPAAQRGGRTGAARSTGFRSPRWRRSPRSACSPASFRARRSTRWPRRPRSPSARTCRASPRSPGCRSPRSRRAAAPTTGCWSQSSSSSRRRLAVDRHPSLRLGRAQARSGLGLRLSRSGAVDAIHRRELQPADPPGVRPARLRRRGADRHAAPGRDAGRPSRSQAAATGSGTSSTCR